MINLKEYIVKVSRENLRIQKMPTLDSSTIKFCPVGTYVIIDEKIGNQLKWGKLKSEDGWICLKYTARID